MGTTIHSTAVIHPETKIAEDVDIGPYAVIEANVEIGRGTRLMSHAFIGKNTTLGEENVVHIGAVIGHAPQDISTTGDEDARLRVGDRNVFREYCTIHRGSRDGTETVVGDENFVMAQAHIAHDCRIGSKTIIASGSLLAGHVQVEDRAFISGNVAVHQFCRVGTLTMVGGIARVNKDAPPYFLIRGDSLVYSTNVIGMERAGMTEEERQYVRKAYKLLYRKGYRLHYALAKIEDTLGHVSPHALRIVEFIRASKRGICAHHRRGAPRK